MFQRIVGFILLLFFYASCDTISSETRSNSIQVSDTIIDYTSVSEYPMFASCKDVSGKAEKQDCFEEELITRLSNSLQRVEYTVKETVNAASKVNLLINQNGKAKVVSIDSPPIIQINLPQLDSIIRRSVDELPILKPALKRGIPVRSQYKLAVEVRSN